MGALDLAVATDAWMAMLRAPDRPTPGAWWAEHEPSLRQLEGEAARVEVDGDQRRGLARDQAALLVDRLLAPVARGRGALDLAIGEGLGALSAGDRTLRLGYCSIGDYARERLGLPARSAQVMAQLSRELREKPLLRQAVLCGEVSASKARAILRVIFGDNEAAWVERARAETVRAL
ncbi:MAG TPA: HNH endonuclease, partial [Anaeromyxobacteraceae bacterium]|nr:HNH endonuclease [Anaeromyxobacteraceae bacterium]